VVDPGGQVALWHRSICGEVFRDGMKIPDGAARWYGNHRPWPWWVRSF
jgi:hypothetical protein